MKKVKKMKSTPFYSSFDELFEKPKLRRFNSKKIKILTVIAVITVSIMASAPFLAVIIVTKVNQSVMAKYQKKLDKIEESQPFTDHAILKENLSLSNPPDYSEANPYSYKIDSDKILLGNGFELKIKNSKGQNEKFAHHDLKIKAKKGYSTIESLALFNFKDPKHEEITTPIGVYISGNLIESYSSQIDKSKGSWAKVYQLPDKWNIKTGYIVNYHSPESSYSANYMVLTRYWIFPDGIGFFVEKGDNFDGTLSIKNGISTTQGDLDIINQYSQGMLGDLQNNFEMLAVE